VLHRPASEFVDTSSASTPPMGATNARKHRKFIVKADERTLAKHDELRDAIAAGQMIKRDNPLANVRVIDSATSAYLISIP